MPSHSEWDLDPDFLTVNHGSFGATPKAVLAAQRAWQVQLERQPSRFMSTVYPTAIRDAANKTAAFLNVNGNDLAFVDNATTGCNAVLRSLTFRGGDEILILSHAYGAVRNTVRYVAEQSGAKIVEAIIPFPDPTEDSLVAAVAAGITPRTRLAVIDHITSGSAIVLPVQLIAEVCHNAGIRILVDGAHAPGQTDLDLAAINADWYVGNCHKWLCAPKGCAFLHAQPSAQAGLHPGSISHGLGNSFLAEFDWTGTTDPSRFLAVTAALDFHQRLGGAKLRQRNKSLAAEGATLISQRLNTQVGTRGGQAGAMATVRLPVDDPTPDHAWAIRTWLMQAGTDAPVHALDGALWLRLSAFAYNEPDDYLRLADRVVAVLRC
jgi:isopenicillin-N epimerase